MPKLWVTAEENQTEGKNRMPLRRLGKKGKAWLSFRRKWFKDNPPNHEGYYECYLCGRWVLQNEVELDHVKSRSRHPELVFDEDNIRPVCHTCNVKKGSKNYEG